jgi:hypothetical protein
MVLPERAGARRQDVFALALRLAEPVEVAQHGRVLIAGRERLGVFRPERAGPVGDDLPVGGLGVL